MFSFITGTLQYAPKPYSYSRGPYNEFDAWLDCCVFSGVSFAFHLANGGLGFRRRWVSAALEKTWRHHRAEKGHNPKLDSPSPTQPTTSHVARPLVKKVLTTTCLRRPAQVFGCRWCWGFGLGGDYSRVECLGLWV